MPAPKHIGSHVNALKRMVQPGDLKLNPDNEREYDRNDESMVRLRQSLKASGVLNPFQIYDDGTVHDGNRRLFNVGILVDAGEWDHGPIPSYIVARPETRADGIIARLNINEASQFSPLAQGEAFGKLREDGYNNAGIAEKTPFSAMHIGNMLTLHDASPDIRDFVRNRSISATLAIEVIRKHGEEVVREAVALALSKGKDKATQRHVDDVVYERAAPASDTTDTPSQSKTPSTERTTPTTPDPAPSATTANAPSDDEPPPWEDDTVTDADAPETTTETTAEEEVIRDADEPPSSDTASPAPQAAVETKITNADEATPPAPQSGKDAVKARTVIKDVLPTIRSLLEAIKDGTKAEKLETLAGSEEDLEIFLACVEKMGLSD